MIKINKKIKTTIQTLNSVALSDLVFINTEAFNVSLNYFDENNQLVDRKTFTYNISDFENIFDKLLKKMLKDDDLTIQ